MLHNDDSSTSSGKNNGPRHRNDKPGGNTGVNNPNKREHDQQHKRRFESNLPGLAKDIYFSYGTTNQVDQFLKSEKEFRMWVGRVYSNEIYAYIKNGAVPAFDEPQAPAGVGDKPPSMAELERFKMKLKQVLDKQERFDQDKGRLFRELASLCDTAMQHKSQSHEKYKELEKDHDVTGLMSLYKELVYSTDNSQEQYWVMAEQMSTLCNLYQTRKETLADFWNRWDGQRKVTEAIYGPLIPSIMKGKATEQQERARDAFLSRLFLGSLNRYRYGSDLDELQNDFVNGANNYPKDPASALSWITNRKQNGNGNNNGGKSNGSKPLPRSTQGHPDLDGDGSTASSFTQLDERTAFLGDDDSFSGQQIEPPNSDKRKTPWYAKGSRNGRN